MKVMLVGLVAMLGVKAEAHWKIVAGKLKFCSICSDATLTEVPPHPDPLVNLPAPAVAELIVKTKLVTISCPDNTEVQLKKPVTLSAQTPSGKWLDWDSKKKTARVEFFVSDKPFVDLGLCGVDQNGMPVQPDAVQILKMNATYNAYECTGSDPTDPCSSMVLVSIMKLNNCTVPPDAPVDTLYVCNTPNIEHVL
jgi:hypothetical protein